MTVMPRRFPWIDRLARAILRIAPGRIRTSSGDDAIATLTAVCTEAYEARGLKGFVRVGSRELAGLLLAVSAARLGRPVPITAGTRPAPVAERRPLMFIDDLHHGWRRLRARPGTALLSVAMLALGIGLTTAMFTLVDALILRPVPFADPDRLARAVARTERGGRTTVPPDVLRAWRDSGVFQGVEGASLAPTGGTAVIDVGGAPQLRGAARVSPGMFALLGVAPIRGRGFLPDEGRAGTEDRVVLSETIWRSAFAADASLIGRTIQVDDRPHVVVGIMPADFRFPRWDTVMWRPVDYLAPPPALRTEQPVAYVRWAAATPADVVAVRATAVLRATDPKMSTQRTFLDPLVTSNRNEYYKRAVPLLAAGVGLVLLVLCANVSGLLLAQFTARRREYGMCSALGASRLRLIREAAAESATLGVLGIVAGGFVAWALVSLARGFLPDALILRSLNPVNLDLRALLAASITGVVATIIAGALPAWIGTSVSASGSLRTVERGGTETRAARVASRALLVSEIALACTLLVGATLLVRSFVNLSAADRGLRADGVLTAWVSAPPTAFPDAASQRAILGSLETSLRELPGVRQVALSFGLPPDGGMIYFGDGFRSDLPDARPFSAEMESYEIRADFLDLYGIPLLRGRTFRDEDPARTAIVGERLAKLFWGEQEAVGRSFSIDQATYQVVGVARETNLPTLEASLDRPEFYTPLRPDQSQTMASIRCDVCPTIPAVRRHIERLHAGLRVHNVGRLEDKYSEQLERPRATALLGSVFAAIAVAAAAGGLLSVLSYSVNRRRREFGIRAALGASATQIRGLVLRDGLVVATIGLAAGTVGAWFLSQALSSMQYGITVADPVSWLIVVAALAATMLAATWRPARQAMRTDPARLLHED
jgi:predicted permease